MRSGRIRCSARTATVTRGSVAGFRCPKIHIAKAARRVAAKEAEAAEAMARVAAQQEAAETIAREKAARRASGYNDIPPPELQPYHRLIIHVEHCMAQRPSPMGSLQGAAERCARAEPSPTLPHTCLGFTLHRAILSFHHLPMCAGTRLPFSTSGKPC